MSDVPKKLCTGPCGQEYDATEEYFHRKKSNKDGLRHRCKECTCLTSRRVKSHSAREGYKYCNTCENELPATTEYFYPASRYKYDVGSKCIECNKKRSKSHHRHNYGKNTHGDRQAYQKFYNSRIEIIEERRARQKIYRSKPEIQEKIKSKDKLYRKRPEIQEKEKTRKKNYRSRPESMLNARVHKQLRRARKKEVSGTHTHAQIQDQLKRQRHKCYYCQARLKKSKGKYIYHIEHTFPLSRVAGSDIPANSIDYLVLSCPTCNMSKGDKFPWEWAEGGRLL